jgi:hypothetical protein
LHLQQLTNGKGKGYGKGCVGCVHPVYCVYTRAATSRRRRAWSARAPHAGAIAGNFVASIDDMILGLESRNSKAVLAARRFFDLPITT